MRLTMDQNIINHQYVFHNIMEDIVVAKARDVVSRMDICQCDKCFADICALTLNKLDPKYVTTENGGLMAKLPEMDPRKELALTVLLSQSAKMVQERPSHLID